MKKYIFHLTSAIILLTSLSSCMSTKKVIYFENKDEINSTLSKTLYDAKIMPKDILQIQVFTMTPEAAAPFNLLKPGVTSSTSTTSTSGQGTIYDYLVDNDGNIEYPVLGTLHLGGMTKTEAEQFIKSKIQPYMAESENVVVHVAMMNYKYAVLGGVRSPGLYSTRNEKVSILEAIAQAGDLTTFAYRDRIFLIREGSDGQKEFHRLDINDANIINSPYYYLQQNDVVYVEPNNIKAQNSKVGQTTTLWFSATSILVSLTSLLYNILK